MSSSSGGGVSILGVVGIIFVVCKIFEIGPIASWSWWLVTLPFWGVFAFFACIVIIFFALAALTKSIR